MKEPPIHETVRQVAERHLGRPLSANEAALLDLIGRAPLQGTWWDLAAWFASEGVLVPDALTEKELAELADIGDSSMPRPAQRRILQELKRIARGDI